VIWRATCALQANGGTALGGGRYWRGHHLAAGRSLRPPEIEDPPSWRWRPCTDLVRKVAQPARAGAAPALLPGRGAGWRIGPACARPGLRQTAWPPAACPTARDGCRSLAAALGPLLQRQQSSPTANGPPGAGRESGGAVPAQRVLVGMTARLLAARCSSNPAVIAWANRLRRVGRPGAGASNGCLGPTQCLVGAAGARRWALSGGLGPGWISPGPRAPATGWSSARAAPELSVIPPPLACCTGCAHPFWLWQSAMPGGQAGGAGEVSTAAAAPAGGGDHRTEHRCGKPVSPPKPVGLAALMPGPVCSFPAPVRPRLPWCYPGGSSRHRR